MNLQDPVFLGYILLLGAIAGFTIYLGLPLARLSAGVRLKAFLNALSVGILIYLFVEIAYKLIEGVEGQMKMLAVGLGNTEALWTNIFLFTFGFSFSLLSLVLFELKFIKPKTKSSDGTLGKIDPKRLALMISAGIGLHNLSEGLVIGQSFATGALSFGYLLVIGFALHNATEGFGIAGPLSGEKPSIKFLALAGLIGGGPTFLGTLIGATFVSEKLESFFLSLAAGAILYVIGELMHLGKLRGQHATASLGLLAGFFIAFISELLIVNATMGDLKKIDLQHATHVTMKSYSFNPNRFVLPAGKVSAIVVKNEADVDHEIEIIGTAEEVESRLGSGKESVVYIYPRKAGRLAMICDMPGHLANGMYGIIDVR